MSYTHQRTYSAADYHEAQRQWNTGSYGPEWEPWRRLAQRAGLLYPPKGSVHDTWDTPSPSQRALVVRAMREMPQTLRWALGRSVQSWSDVLTAVHAERDTLRQSIEADEAPATPAPGHREAAMSLAAVFERVATSIGYQPARRE